MNYTKGIEYYNNGLLSEHFSKLCFIVFQQYCVLDILKLCLELVLLWNYQTLLKGSNLLCTTNINFYHISSMLMVDSYITCLRWIFCGFYAALWILCCSVTVSSNRFIFTIYMFRVCSVLGLYSIFIMKFILPLSKTHTINHIFENYHVNVYFLKNYNSKISLSKIYIIKKYIYLIKNSRILYIDTLFKTVDTSQQILVNICHNKLQINISMKNYYQKQVYNNTLSYLIKILYINKTNLQIFLLIMMKIIFPILTKIYFSIMMKRCFLTTRFMKIYCLEITISLLIRKLHTSNFIYNALLKQIFLEALYVLDFKCLKYTLNKYVLILSVVINLSVMHSICCKKQGQYYSWFQYTSFIY